MVIVLSPDPRPWGCRRPLAGRCLASDSRPAGQRRPRTSLPLATKGPGGESGAPGPAVRPAGQRRPVTSLTIATIGRGSESATRGPAMELRLLILRNVPRAGPSSGRLGRPAGPCNVGTERDLRASDPFLSPAESPFPRAP